VVAGSNPAVPTNFLWHTARSQKASKETLGCFLIPSFLQTDINNLAILIHCTPKLVLFTIDLDDHLVQNLSIAKAGMPSF